MTKRSELAPERHPQRELFICEIGDTFFKSDVGSMEHPIFAVSSDKDVRPREYQHGSTTLVVEPGPHGLATILDKDILIFAISKLMEAKNAGEPISRQISFTAYDYLVFTNRQTSGMGYENLKKSLARLDGTRLRTNIKTGGEEQWEAFGLIDGAKIRRSDKSGRVIEWGITLSEWLFRAVENTEILTLHPDYFRLRKPMERRIYELARKHCGRQPQWKIRVELLHLKTGSVGPVRQLRYWLKELIKTDHLPDYSMEYDPDRDMVIFHKRPEANLDGPSAVIPSISVDGFDAAKAAAPGWDIYRLEQEWRAWASTSGKQAIKNADRAFVGFCKKWFEQRGRP